MTTQPLSPLGLKLQLEQKLNETIVHCEGKITAENSVAFQREIRDLIPESQGQIATKSYRIVLDLSNVAYVDSTGLGALLGVWTAAEKKECDLEIANLNPRVEKLVEITKLDTVFKRSRVVAWVRPRLQGRLSETPRLRWSQKRLTSRHSRLEWSFTVPIRLIARPPFPL